MKSKLFNNTLTAVAPFFFAVRDHCFLFISTAALTLFTGNPDLYAQDSYRKVEEDHYWFNAGLGTSSFGGSLGISASYQTGRSLASVRFIYNEEFNILGPSPSESVWDFGALYGINAKGSLVFASVSGGVSFVTGVRRGKYLGSSGWFSSNYESEPFVTVGIPVEGQLFWTPLNFLGIGFYGFANLNPEKSFVGALLSIQLGKLR